MNINMNIENLRYLDLFGRSNSAGQLTNAKIVNGARIADVKTSKDNLGCSVSISEESKNMLEQLNEDKKQEEPELITEHKSITMDGKDYKIIDATVSFSSDKWRMVYAAYQCNDFQKGGTLNFDCLKSAYEEIRKELESQYTDEELEKHLNLLDADYEDTVAYITDSVTYAIKFRGSIEGKEGERKAIEAIFGMNMDDFNDMLSKMGIGKNQPFWDSATSSFDLEAIIKFIAQKAKESIKSKI